MDDPIQLTRFGPPEFKRPTLADFEDTMIDLIDGQTDEDIAEELRQAGIDMAPAIEKLRLMIDKKKAELASVPMSETREDKNGDV